MSEFKFLSFSVLFFVGLILMAMAGCPMYGVYHQEMEGKAELAKADFSKQVAVQEAKAKQESAHYLAEAEVIRAEGIAKANAIVGNSLKDNEAYLRWLYIESLKDNTNKQIIYIPTEGALPILESGRAIHH